MLSKLRRFDEIIVSAGYAAGKLPDSAGGAIAELCTKYGAVLITDARENCGPMEGLRAALGTCKHGALFAAPCDMPLLTDDLIMLLLTESLCDCDATVAVTGDGREQPLCAVYKKSVANVFETQIAKGDFKLTNALSLMRVNRVDIAKFVIPDSVLANINTPGEYHKLVARNE